MLGLLFNINGDSSGFRKEMDKTKQVASKGGDEVAKAFGAQFKSAMLGVIGAGAIVGRIKKIVGEAVRIDSEALKEGLGIEAFQELERAAKATGMSIEDLRKAAPEAAAEFTRLMDTIRKDGGILDKATVQQLSDASAELERAVQMLAPVVVAAVKFVNVELGRIIAGSKAITGALMPFAQVLGVRPKGVDSLGETLVQSGFDQAQRTRWGSSAFGRNQARQRGEEFRAAVTAQRKAVVMNELNDQALAKQMQSMPLVGGIAGDLIQGMWKVAEEQKKTREEIAKRL